MSAQKPRFRTLGSITDTNGDVHLSYPRSAMTEWVREHLDTQDVPTEMDDPTAISLLVGLVRAGSPSWEPALLAE